MVPPHRPGTCGVCRRSASPLSRRKSVAPSRGPVRLSLATSRTRRRQGVGSHLRRIRHHGTDRRRNPPGTYRGRWIAAIASVRIPDLGPIRERRIVIMAPHPDDEVLGAGGLIQKALRERCLVEIIAVTDGEASHRTSDFVRTGGSGAFANESPTWLSGASDGFRPIVTRLHLPDGAVATRSAELYDALEDMLLPDDLCVAPWQRDGHPDHDASGEAALRASRRVSARSWVISCGPGTGPTRTDVDIPWTRVDDVDLGRRARARKRWSTLAFRSQVRPIGPIGVDAPILPPHLLRRFWRPYEIYVQEGGRVMTSTSRVYFEEMYAQSDDPWEFETSDYEQTQVCTHGGESAQGTLRQRLRTWLFCGRALPNTWRRDVIGCSASDMMGAPLVLAAERLEAHPKRAGRRTDHPH